MGAAFLVGAVAVVWVAWGFVGTNPLALVMTLLIGAVYGAGAFELLHFRRATGSLVQALANIPQPLPALDAWLQGIHPSLQNPVRLRIEGERIGLPGPALTPYLVGLLVMLGMLGTFLGMVVTFNGAVFALEGTTDLPAIRAAMAAPIKGLGLAFGTSVAGVAASAMLGLMSALSRRERMQAAQLLETRISTALRGFSLAHQRQETFQAIQRQAQALPEVVEKLQAMMTQLDRREQALNERLLGNQEAFHRDATAAYQNLAEAVGKSLNDSLVASARVAGDTIRPAVEVALAGLAQESSRLHADLAATVQEANNVLLAKQTSSDQARLAAWTASLDQTADRLNAQWQQASAQTLVQQQQICVTLEQTARQVSEQNLSTGHATLAEVNRLLAGAETLLQSRLTAEAEWLTQQGARMDQLATLWRSELSALRAEEAERGQQAVDRLGELQAALGSHLATLGTALEAPMSQLIASASEAPRAAAEVIAQLRQEISHSVARDNQLLEERSRIMDTLNSLLAAINHASAEQRVTIDALVASSAAAMAQAGKGFAESVGEESAKLSNVAAQVTGSAVEVAALGESFGFAVQLFNASNEKMIASLQKIEASMDKSTQRSDEQLAYYVAQAREIIDLSIMSQKEVVEELRQLTERPALTAPQVA